MAHMHHPLKKPAPDEIQKGFSTAIQWCQFRFFVDYI